MPDGDALDATVVIAARDAADTIAAQLDALAAQRGDVAFEVVVADNGSRDATASVAEAHAGRLHLRVVDASARPGAGFARNVGASVAHGRVVAFCDADDAVEPGWLAALVPAALADGLATGPLVLVDAHDRTPRTEPERPFGFLPTAPTANLAVRRDLFDALGGFTTEYDAAGGEDADLCWRAQLDEGATLAWVPEARVRYTVRASRREHLRRVWHYEQCNARLYVRFRDRGMGRERAGLVLREGVWFARHPVKTLRRPRQRDQMLRWLVQHSSRAWASVRLRVLFP